MPINYDSASNLEVIVRNANHCEANAMGLMISAHHFKTEPFDAALLAIAPLWRSANQEELEDFFSTWEPLLRTDNPEDSVVSDFVKALSAFVSKLMDEPREF